MSTPEARLREAEQSGDRAAERAAAEEILASRGARLPPVARAGLHFLIGDAIMSQEERSPDDLELAISHLRAAVADGAHLPRDALASANHQIDLAAAELGPPGDESELTLEEVINASLEPELRRHMLASWLERHGSADEERARYLYESLILPIETELEAMGQAARKRKDKQLLAEAKQAERDKEAYYKRLLDLDRQSNTHQKAVDIIRAHLERAEPFVLLLRNFDLEIGKGTLPKDREAPSEIYGAPVMKIGTVVWMRNENTERFESGLAKRAAVLKVSDVADAAQLNRSPAVSGLRVLASEWQPVVSLLIGEAAAVVVFVQHMTQSLQLELSLIEMHGAAARASVLMMEPDDEMSDMYAMSLDGYDRAKARLAYESLQEAIGKQFGPALFQLESLTDANRDPIIDRIVTLIDRQ